MKKNQCVSSKSAPDARSGIPFITSHAYLCALPLLKDSVAAFYEDSSANPQLEVEPLFKTTILGEVRTPNIYFVAPGLLYRTRLLRGRID